MAAFFVRRLVGGAIEVFLLGFLFYALLIPPFISNWGYTTCDIGCDRALQRHFVKVVTVMYASDNPWPSNYLTWLYNPGGTRISPYPFGNGAPILTIVSVDSGVLAGDFGYSTQVEPGAPVLTVLGLDGAGLPLLLGVPFCTLLFFMLIVLLQRWGRPVVYALPVPDNPVRSVWRRAELWPLG